MSNPEGSGALAHEVRGEVVRRYAPLVGFELNGRRVYQALGGKGSSSFTINLFGAV